MEAARSRDVRPPARKAPHRPAIGVLVLGAGVTALLTVASRINYVHNEQRLTTLQTELTASALGVAPEDLERRLGQAAVAAAQSSRPVTAFKQVIADSMSPKGPFITAALAEMRAGAPHVLVTIGVKPARNPTSTEATAVLQRAARTGSLVTTRIVAPGIQRFGYAMSATGPAGTFVVGAGQPLPDGRRVSVPASSPLSGLDFALYFGPTKRSSALVETNSSRLPLSGTTSTASVPFGDSVLTLVISPRSPLAGEWSAWISWFILVVGVLFTIAIAAMTERFVHRRELAEVLASENRRLFQEQRGVAETLQHSLLPRALPARDGLLVAARYLAGTAELEVGGDWYDVVELDEHHVLFSVGDVAGRGLEAAVLMSMLRNAIKAFASEDGDPASVLTRLARMVDVGRDGRFATVLCGRIDTATGALTLANAGHLEPLLTGTGSARFAPTALGPPIGVEAAHYGPTQLTLHKGSTLLAFTDGLVERRTELLSIGLERLRLAAVADLPLEALLDEVLSCLVPSGSHDDVAILALRWQP